MEQIANIKEINYAIALKLNMLRKEHLPQLSLEDFSYAIIHGKWHDKIPVHTSQAVDEILSVSAEDVVVTLTRLALTEGGKANIDEFQDLLGGNNYENN